MQRCPLSTIRSLAEFQAVLAIFIAVTPSSSIASDFSGWRENTDSFSTGGVYATLRLEDLQSAKANLELACDDSDNPGLTATLKVSGTTFDVDTSSQVHTISRMFDSDEHFTTENRAITVNYKWESGDSGTMTLSGSNNHKAEFGIPFNHYSNSVNYTLPGHTLVLGFSVDGTSETASISFVEPVAAQLTKACLNSAAIAAAERKKEEVKEEQEAAQRASEQAADDAQKEKDRQAQQAAAVEALQQEMKAAQKKLTGTFVGSTNWHVQMRTSPATRKQNFDPESFSMNVQGSDAGDLTGQGADPEKLSDASNLTWQQIDHFPSTYKNAISGSVQGMHVHFVDKHVNYSIDFDGEISNGGKTLSGTWSTPGTFLTSIGPMSGTYTGSFEATKN